MAIALAACTGDRFELHIAASSETDVRTLEVRVIALAGGAIEHGRSSRLVFVDRKKAEIDAEPIAIDLDLGAPSSVMVHLTASSPGGELLAATRCYEVGGVVRDRVLLARIFPENDRDGDGWAADPSGCFDPPLEPGGPWLACDFRCPAIAADCDDRPRCDGTDPSCIPPDTIFPGALDRCTDGLDQDCSGADRATCLDEDGDSFVLCSGTAAPETCDCDDHDALVHPGAPDCESGRDGLDQDCNGSECCDEDGDGVCASIPIGGVPDCDDTDAAVLPGARELCTAPGAPPADENCNALVDELAECAGDDLDRDGFDACSVSAAPCDCNDCDPGVHPSIADRACDGIDQDCDGVDPCDPEDADRDGMTVGSGDCDDADPTIREGLSDRCGDAIDQDCSGGDSSCDVTNDPDRDGFASESAECAVDPDRHPGALERCDGLDADCNGVADDVLSSERGCVGASATTCALAACEVDYASSIYHCGGCRTACNAGALTVALACDAGRCDCPAEPGVGTCAGGQSCCAEAGCADLATDVANCGSCGNDCSALAPELGGGGRSDGCAAGACACAGGAPCGLGERCCGGCVARCTDMNCGGCGATCGARGHCVEGAAGACGCACDAPFDDCNGDAPSSASDGCETDTSTSPLHCGGCGRACDLPNTDVHECAGGSCRPVTCDAGFEDCDGVAENGCERNVRTLTDCDGCGVACSLPNAVATCASGECRIAHCAVGFGECDANFANGCETSTRTLSDCGSCDVACALQNAIGSCTSGACVVETCLANRGNCDYYDDNGCEIDLLTDRQNCGRCENFCNPDEACVAGACVPS
jgi:hypothetical protein